MYTGGGVQQHEWPAIHTVSGKSRDFVCQIDKKRAYVCLFDWFGEADNSDKYGMV